MWQKAPAPMAERNSRSIPLRFRSGFRLAFRCCPWVTPTEEDRLELTHIPSLSRKVNRCHTKETLFMTGDMTPSEATNGQVRSPQDGEAGEP